MSQDASPADQNSSDTSSPNETPTTYYALFGGHDTFVRLVDRFYEGVADDPILRPMYPDEKLDGAKDRLRMFLEQYWGGPSTYSQERGHPRLRMRHYPFPVGPQARDAWLKHMKVAVDSLDLPPEQHHLLWDYLERAANSLLNRADDVPVEQHRAQLT